MEFVFDTENKSRPSAPDFDLITSANTNSRNSFGNEGSFGSTSGSRRTRRTVANNFSDIEFNEPAKTRKKSTRGPKVNYVDPIKKRRKTAKKKTSKFEWSWTKLCWLGCAFLVLRLMFMENGVMDYYSMNNTLKAKNHELQLLRQENADLITEIHKIQTSQKYQKKVAREHLGVISPGEFLVVFANDRSAF